MFAARAGFMAGKAKAPLAVGSVGAGASANGGNSASWSHTITADDSYVIAAVSGYNAATSGSATFGSTALTQIYAGYRLSVYAGAITSGAGTYTVTINQSGIYPMNSISFKGATGLGTVVGYSGNDYGNHTLAASSTSGSIIVWLVGQAYASSDPGASVSIATRQFWTSDSGGNASVGSFTNTANGSSQTFALNTGQWGSIAAVPVIG